MGLDLLKPADLGGGRRTVMTLFACSPGAVWPTDHVGCARSSPYCVLSIAHDDGHKRNPADKTPIVRTPHLSEILVMRDNALEVRRLVEHRSVLFTNEEADAYWSYPRAAISGDGRMVIAESNFGESGAYRIILIETGFGRPKLAAGGIVNAASLEPLVAPGGLVKLTGTSLSNCAQVTATSPLKTDFCGGAVTFNGAPAPFYYADLEQVNVVVPERVEPERDLTIVVSRDGVPSDPVVVPASAVRDVAPAIYGYVANEVRRAVVQNSDYSLNGPINPDFGSRPLRLSEAATAYANALGPTTPAVSAGEATPLTTLARTNRNVDVYVNGVQQQVLFAGLTPGSTALYQVNFILSPTTPVSADDQNVLWLEMGDARSPKLPISISE